MKKLNIKWMLSLIAAFTFASCDTDVDHDIPAVDTPYWCLLLLKVEQPK